LVLEPLQAFLDERSLGAGPIKATEIGGGHSNVTYLLVRGEDEFVVRRPPRGPLPPRAHDVLREAALLSRLSETGLPVPAVLGSCADKSVIGAPFFVMSFVDAVVLDRALPAGYAPDTAPGEVADALVAGLAAIHAVELESVGMTRVGRQSDYLERQLAIFGANLEQRRRSLPGLDRVGAWLVDQRPQSGPSTLVHGDYRLGNILFGRCGPKLRAILDWEMATVGDPLADLGYLTAMWAEPDEAPDPMLDLCPLSKAPGFPTREDLRRRYEHATGRSTEHIVWYQVFAIWKAATFLEASFCRYLDRTTDDPYFASLEQGVPALADRAEALLAGPGTD
jgi:aminoglycoside phosphotransferase (APT) family kinase protein